MGGHQHFNAKKLLVISITVSTVIFFKVIYKGDSTDLYILLALHKLLLSSLLRPSPVSLMLVIKLNALLLLRYKRNLDSVLGQQKAFQRVTISSLIDP